MSDDPDAVTVFELRGIYVFRYEGDETLPTRVESAYNPDEQRYELPDRGLLERVSSVLDVTVVESDSVHEYKVEFPRDGVPESVAAEAVFTEEGPMTETVLLPTTGAVKRAVDAGGSRVEADDGGV